MQIRFAEIAWITVNVEGSRVTAILEEAVPPPAVVEDGIPTNLIAGETGFITRVEVQNGNAVVKPGDSVLAGDLLVSGIMDNKMGESRLAHARGRVYAQVRERLEIFGRMNSGTTCWPGWHGVGTLPFSGWKSPCRGGAPPWGRTAWNRSSPNRKGFFRCCR